MTVLFLKRFASTSFCRTLAPEIDHIHINIEPDCCLVVRRSCELRQGPRACTHQETLAVCHPRQQGANLAAHVHGPPTDIK